MTLLRRALGLLLLAALIAPQTVPASATPAGAPGVTPRRIKIGIHAPITGAAPLPTESFQKGADLYFRWLERQGVKINGRYVDVVFKNDNYNPSQAVAVCKEMVEEQSVFMLVGAAGASQIQACARYAASAEVPYLSWGASEVGLTRLPGYFATSMSHDDQARLVADLLVVKHDAKNQQNAVIWTNSPFEERTRDRFVAAMESRGVEIHLDRSYPKGASASDAEVIANEMRIAGIDNAFFLGRTTFWLQLENASDNQGENVQWVGVDQTFGTDGAVGVLCNQSSGLKAAMLSAIPAFVDRDRFDRKHDKAMQALYNERGDDTTWRGWALGRNIAEMLRKSPRNLTRGSFVDNVTDSTITTGITPKLPYGKGGSFVARKTHLLRADCETRHWKTTQTFVSNF